MPRLMNLAWPGLAWPNFWDKAGNASIFNVNQFNI